VAQDVVLLTLGEGVYEAHVQRLRRVYAALHNAGKRHERELQDVRTKQEAVDCGLRCVEVSRAGSNWRGTCVAYCLLRGEPQELQQIVEDHAQALRETTDMVKVGARAERDADLSQGLTGGNVKRCRCCADYLTSTWRSRSSRSLERPTSVRADPEVSRGVGGHYSQVLVA
jgi:hypothetical protein